MEQQSPQIPQICNISRPDFITSRSLNFYTNTARSRKTCPESVRMENKDTETVRRRYDLSEKGKAKYRRYGKTEDGREKRRQYSHEHIRERRSLRRARERNVAGIHTAEDIQSQFDAQQGLCWWCSQKLEAEFHVDHVIPIARGGTNWPSNIVCACSFCNRSKGEKLAYVEWQPPNPLKPRKGNTELQQ